MSYVDGFVAAVPTLNKEVYMEHSKIAAAVFKEYGALKVIDCWGDDVPDGEVTSFPMAVKKQDNESILFGWIIWPDKSTRDSGMQKALVDPRMSVENNPPPFDGKRLIYGGFQIILES